MKTNLISKAVVMMVVVMASVRTKANNKLFISPNLPIPTRFSPYFNRASIFAAVFG
jgi:hypothetical protein